MVQSGLKYSLYLLWSLCLFSSSVVCAQSKPAAPVKKSNESICCNAASGQRVCGDLLPPQCTDRAYRVYDRQGLLVREVGPPPTPEEKAAIVEAAKQARIIEAQEKEQRRKDQALRETYASIEDIDRMRAQSEVDLKAAITDAETKIAVAKKRRKRFEQEAEFYPNKELLPANVAKGLRDEDVEIKNQEELIASKKQEMEAIRLKYEEDRRRYIEISRPRTRRTVNSTPKP